MSVFFNFKEASGNLRVNVAFKSEKKISGNFFKENSNFLNVSNFLYISYGARFLFNIFSIVKNIKYLWTFFIAYSLTTFITLLLVRFWPV